MKVYGVVGENQQMIDETEMDAPLGWIEMLEARPEGDDAADYTAQADGTWAITQETLNAKLAPAENEWREQQMPIARNNVTAIQFGDEDIPGTEQQWKDYWLALRKWTQGNPDFPDQEKRPIAPA